MGKSAADRGRKAEDRGRKTEDRRQRTEDRGQKTEDRGQRTEDRRRRAEGGRRKAEDGRQRAEDGRQRMEAEDRGQKAEGGGLMGEKRVSSFRELRVYQAAFELQQEIFEETKEFPKAELYSLTDQIRRSSRSIGGNIAEAWQKRRYPAHFVSKLSDADGEQAETQHWLDTARKCRYISPECHDRLMNACRDIGRMLGAMINKPETFCKNQ